MELGFETVGNATMIVHDDGPVLVTDPWLDGPAYFGSWGLSHEVPPEQRAAALGARTIWFSHGHPDHLNPGALAQIAGRKVLLADHVGGRIAGALVDAGHDVEVLPDGRWVPISPRVRVLSVADAGQDSILLVDVGGRLVVNLNDASDRGWGGLVRRTIASFDRSFVLRLAGYGDADMINFFDAEGKRIPSGAQLRKERGFQVGADVARMTETFGASAFVPFSAFHRYERTDSAWANEWTTDLADYADGFRSSRVELLPAFVRYECTGERWEDDPWSGIDPRPRPLDLHAPEEFGDDWSDELDGSDVDALRAYFGSIEALGRHLDAVTFRVGGRDTTIDLPSRRRSARRTGRGVVFEVPRASLRSAIDWEIFDDLLIGNFMRTTLEGRWPTSGLYPGFTPWVTKYADNGRAHTDDELRAYFATYRRRTGTAAWMRTVFEERAKTAVRSRVRPDAPAFLAARDAYARVRAGLRR